jgi:hypothetical protein
MRFCGLLTLLFLIGCTAPKVIPLMPDQYEEFIRTGWQPAVPQTEATIIAKFGPPQPVIREPFRNRHVEGQVDSIVELQYPKLRVKLYEMPDSQLMMQVEISDPKLQVAHGLHVGVTEQQLLELLGPPDKKQNDDFVYSAHLGAEASVTFGVKNHTVERMEWDLPVD